MNLVHISAMAAVISGALTVWTPTAQPSEKARAGAKPDTADVVFGFDKLHQLHLAMSANEWQAMQPADPRPFGRFPGRGGRLDPPQREKASGDRLTHRSGMMEYPIARGDLSEGGKTYQNVAVRYKGNFTYMASAHLLKRSLKIDFEQSGKDTAGYYGLGKFNLHAGVLDPTRQREALSYEVFRAARVPASRTAFVELTLTVPGKYNREEVRLFTLVEQVDERFLKRWFKNGKGLLLKPQGVRGPEYLGDKWEQYDGLYRPNRPPSSEEAQRIIDFARLVTNASEDQFRSQINSFLDVDEFLRFLAATAMLVNLDSPLAMPQNFYLYLDAQTQRFIFMPWDLDLSMAAWPMGVPPAQQMDLSLMHPHAGEHRLIDRLLAVPAIKEKYKAVLKQLATSAFAKERLLRNIETIESTTKESLAREAKAAAARHESGRSGFGMGMDIAARAPLPRTFVEKRTESIQAQLTGVRKGYTPGSPFGPPGGPRGFERRLRPPGTER